MLFLCLSLCVCVSLSLSLSFSLFFVVTSQTLKRISNMAYLHLSVAVCVSCSLLRPVQFRILLIRDVQDVRLLPLQFFPSIFTSIMYKSSSYCSCLKRWPKKRSLRLFLIEIEISVYPALMSMSRIHTIQTILNNLLLEVAAVNFAATNKLLSVLKLDRARAIMTFISVLLSGKWSNNLWRYLNLFYLFNSRMVSFYVLISSLLMTITLVFA